MQLLELEWGGRCLPPCFFPPGKELSPCPGAHPSHSCSIPPGVHRRDWVSFLNPVTGLQSQLPYNKYKDKVRATVLGGEGKLGCPVEPWMPVHPACAGRVRSPLKRVRFEIRKGQPFLSCWLWGLEHITGLVTRNWKLSSTLGWG